MAKNKGGRPKLPPIKCRVAVCENMARVRSHGLCSGHEHRMRSGLVVDVPLRKLHRSGRPDCVVEGCGRRKQSHGYCWAHWRRQIGTVPADKPISWRRVKGENKSCQVAGCLNKPKGRYCGHHKKLQRQAEVFGEPDSWWKRPLAPRTPNGWTRMQEFRVKPSVAKAIENYASSLAKSRSMVISEALEEWWHEFGRARLNRLKFAESREAVESDPWARDGDTMGEAFQ